MPPDAAPFDPDKDDPYEVLGIGRAASAAEVRAAWVALIKHTHSDRVGDALSAEAKRINAAYVELRDPATRPSWDRAHASSAEASRPRQSRRRREPEPDADLRTTERPRPEPRSRPAATTDPWSPGTRSSSARSPARDARPLAEAAWRRVARSATRAAVAWVLQPMALRFGTSEWANGVALRVAVFAVGAVLVWLSAPYVVAIAQWILEIVLAAIIILLGVLLLLAASGLRPGGSRRSR